MLAQLQTCAFTFLIGSALAQGQFFPDYFKELTGKTVNVTFCSFRYEREDGYLYSPDYPFDYPPLSDCIYEFIRPSEDYCGIKFFVEQLGIEGEEPCDQDFLEVLSCQPRESARLCGRQIGTSYQYTFQENAESFLLRFLSNGGISGPGFRIRYQMIQICAGPFTAPDPTPLPSKARSDILCKTRTRKLKGSLFSPDFPSPYPTATDCIYEIERANGNICGLRIKSAYFDLPSPLPLPLGLGYCGDFFQLPSCGYVCGSEPIDWLVQYQPGATSLSIHFHSATTNSAGKYHGFLLEYEQIYDCEFRIT